MSTLSRTTVISGAAVVACTAVFGPPAQSLPADTDADAHAKTCEATVLPGPDGVDDRNFTTAVDSTGTYTTGVSEPQNGTEIPLLWKDDKLEAAIEIPDPQDTMTRDVNAKGQVILDDHSPNDDRNRVFVYADGKVTQLDQLGAPRAYVRAIADDGTIVGSITNTPKDYKPVTWDANDPTAKPQTLELGDNKPSGAAYDIDGAGNITGLHYTPGPDPEPSGVYLWKNGEGTPSQLPLPEDNGNKVGVTPVDYDQGWALAFGVPGNVPTYYLYAPGEKPVESAPLDRPSDVTADGWVTGSIEDGESTSAALVSPDGEVTDLPVPDGFAQASAHYLSADASVITGTASDADPDTPITAAVKWTCQ